MMPLTATGMVLKDEGFINCQLSLNWCKARLLPLTTSALGTTTTTTTSTISTGGCGLSF